MPDLNDADRQALIERLRELGPDGVRHLLASDGFPTTHRIEIARWLAEQAGAGHEPAREHDARHRGKRPA